MPTIQGVSIPENRANPTIGKTHKHQANLSLRVLFPQEGLKDAKACRLRKSCGSTKAVEVCKPQAS